jgi:streptogramin lyase
MKVHVKWGSAVAVLGVVAGLNGPAWGVINNGDVLAAVGAGKIKHFTPAGTLIETFDSTTGSSETTGMCFDAAGNLYATMFETNTISKFDPNGVLIKANFTTTTQTPESCQINKAGDLLVGNTGGHIQRYNASTGALLQTYNTPIRTGWIDIAADQCTVFYADDSVAVSRYNICTDSPLPNFVNVTNLASGLRILANGDVLVSNRNSVVRYNSAGVLQATYPAPPGNNLIFAVTVDPDGQTFWTADLQNGNIFRYNLNPPGPPITTFNSGQFVDTAGLVIKGELTVGGPPPGGPPPGPVVVPSLSMWGIVALVMLVGGVTFFRFRRASRHPTTTTG